MNIFNKFGCRMVSKIKDLQPESITKIEKDAREFWSESNKNKEIQDISHWRGIGSGIMRYGLN
ncbi:MAG: hypothetical protein K8R67_13695 [Desulfobacteraceae bacterium]|nr:hypothetical protein [Desulfobacteraceae bacterium]